MKSLTRKTAWLSAVIAAFAAVAAWADGELDGTFGTNGVVKISFPMSTRGYLHSAQTLTNGTIEVAGFEQASGLPTSTTPAPNIFVASVSAGGIVTSMNSYPQSPAPAALKAPGGVVIAPRNGDLFVVGSNVGSDGLFNAGALWLSSAGSLRSHYSRPATGSADQSACPNSRPILDNQGRLVVACVYGDRNGTLQLAALRLIPRVSFYKSATYNLIADTTFGSKGYSIIATFPAGFSFAGATAITQDPSSGAYYVAGFACTSNCLAASANQTVAQLVARLSGADGKLDTAYGNSGFAVAFQPMATGGNPESIALDNSGNALIGGNYSTTGSLTGSGYVARLVPSGTPDGGFGSGGVVQGVAGNEVIDVHTDAVNRIYALDHGTRLYRLNAGGAPDTSFNSGTDVQALNGPGSVWQSMQFVNPYQFSAYLVGGVSSACSSSCATTAVIARVTLITSTSATSLVSSLNPSTEAIPVTFTATVTGTNPTGTVTFQDGTTTLATATLAGGSATYTTSLLSVGYHSMTAVYAGDANNGPSSTPTLTQTVNTVIILPTTTDLTVTPATASVGQLVTLTATVTGAPGSNPTGLVSFMDGTTPLGTATLTTGGTATLSTNVLEVGSHAITADYFGDGRNGPSSSATAPVTVNLAASTAALTLTPASSTVGQSITLSATVTGVPGLTPTGMVSFVDGSTTLGTGTLMADGTAAFSTAALAAGNHSLTVGYGGDSNYSPTTSTAVTETVIAMPPGPSSGGGGGGGGGLGLVDLGALALLVLARVRRRRFT
jgi:Bacterial Ig-like domain (group 3)